MSFEKQWGGLICQQPPISYDISSLNAFMENLLKSRSSLRSKAYIIQCHNNLQSQLRCHSLTDHRHDSQQTKQSALAVWTNVISTKEYQITMKDFWPTRPLHLTWKIDKQYYCCCDLFHKLSMFYLFHHSAINLAIIWFLSPITPLNYDKSGFLLAFGKKKTTE